MPSGYGRTDWDAGSGLYQLNQGNKGYAFHETHTKSIWLPLHECQEAQMIDQRWQPSSVAGDTIRVLKILL